MRPTYPTVKLDVVKGKRQKFWLQKNRLEVICCVTMVEHKKPYRIHHNLMIGSTKGGELHEEIQTIGEVLLTYYCIMFHVCMSAH